MVTSIKSKPKYEIKKLETHGDQRGWLVELLKANEIKESIKQINVITIKPGCIRGNHYHSKRIEWFFLAEGKARFILRDINTGQRVQINLSPIHPKLITIFPNVAHAIKNIGKRTAYLVEAQNNIYNPKKTDSFSFETMS